MKTAADYFESLSRADHGQRLPGRRRASRVFGGNHEAGARRLQQSARGTLTVRQTSLVMLQKGYAVSFTFIGGSEDEVNELIEKLSFATAKTADHFRHPERSGQLAVANSAQSKDAYSDGVLGSLRICFAESLSEVLPAARGPSDYASRSQANADAPLRMHYSSASGSSPMCFSPAAFFSTYFLTQASQLFPAAVSRPVKARAAMSE